MNYSNNLSNNTMYESGNHKKIITKGFVAQRFKS